MRAATRLCRRFFVYQNGEEGGEKFEMRFAFLDLELTWRVLAAALRSSVFDYIILPNLNLANSEESARDGRGRRTGRDRVRRSTEAPGWLVES